MILAPSDATDVEAYVDVVFSVKSVILQRFLHPNIRLLLKKTTVHTVGLSFATPSVEILLGMKPVW